MPVRVRRLRHDERDTFAVPVDRAAAFERIATRDRWAPPVAALDGA